jgi:hypothetical protein
MHSFRFFVLSICTMITLLASAFSMDELRSMRDMGNQALTAFQKHQDDEGLRLFKSFFEQVRSSRRYEQDTQIELLVGIMGCALPEYRDMGEKALRRVLQTGKGIESRRSALNEALRKCSAKDTPNVQSVSMMEEVPADSSGGEVSGSFKGGGPITRVPSVTVSHVDAATLEKRLEETKDPATALAPTLARAGSGAQGIVSDHFIVVTDSGGEPAAKGIASCLDGYGADLSKEFDMGFPPHLITVYNMQWNDTMYKAAGSLHGIKLARGTIAYSVYADLSMMGIGDPKRCGSLAHELTHLMIKGNFGDAPAWLEEGLASAVALSTPKGGRLEFHQGWRDKVLRQNAGMRPSVDKLLSLTWADFSPADAQGLSQVATIQAMASVFVRYLAAKNKLDRVYFAVREQDLNADLEHYRSSREIMEKVLGKSVEEIDQDFMHWFTKDSAEKAKNENSSQTQKKPCKNSINVSPMEQQTAPCEPATAK